MPFAPSGHHPFAQVALGMPTNASFLPSPFSGIPTSPSGNAFVGGRQIANFVTGQRGAAHCGVVRGENYGRGGIWVQGNTGMSSCDVGGAVGSGPEGAVAYAAESVNDRTRTEGAPLETRQGCGRRKRSADSTGLNTYEKQRQQRRRR